MDFKPERFGKLSEREKEILYWTCRGWKVGQIAKRLKLGHSTVESYRYRTHLKLDLWSDIVIALYAYKYKIVDFDWLNDESLPSGNDYTEASAEPT